jgi:ribonuclease BN (tRNA processing enzyme)
VQSPVRSPAGLWVEAGEARVRLDCGAGSVPAMARFGLDWETMSHQFISHFHLDHVGELPMLLFALRWGRLGPRRPFTLAGPVGLRALLEKLAEAFDEELLDPRCPFELRELGPGETLALDGAGAQLRVEKTPHTPESLAVRVEAGGRALGFTGDTAPSDELARFFAGVDLLVAECSFAEDAHGTRHLRAEDAARLAAAAGAGRLVVTHFYFDPEAERLAERLAARFSGPIAVAVDGMSLDV